MQVASITPWCVNNQIDYKNVLTYEASRIKGRNICRCLYLKIKRLITDFEKLLNKKPGLYFDIMRANHLSSTRPANAGDTKYCPIHHMVLHQTLDDSGEVIMDGQSEHLPTQFFRIKNAEDM